MNPTKVNDKIRLFALCEPINLRMSLCFTQDALVSDIHHFVNETMKKYTIKYRVGRVDWNGSWILPQYKIIDFLEDKSEITIYSVEYGLTLTSLAGERDRIHINYGVFSQDINQAFINKKRNRDKRRISSHASNPNDTVVDMDDDDQPVIQSSMDTVNEDLEIPKNLQHKETAKENSNIKENGHKDQNNKETKPKNEPQKKTNKDESQGNSNSNDPKKTKVNENVSNTTNPNKNSNNKAQSNSVTPNSTTASVKKGLHSNSVEEKSEIKKTYKKPELEEIESVKSDSDNDDAEPPQEPVYKTPAVQNKKHR